MFGIGIPEVIIIGLAIAVLFFGGKKALELSRSLGRVTGEFKKGKQDIERELRESEREAMKSETDFKAPMNTTPEPTAPGNQPTEVPKQNT